MYNVHIFVPIHVLTCRSHVLLTHIQINYFGLQYQTKYEQYRWVDKEKPLRKQLEKNGIDGAKNAELRFRVQYYVTNITKLKFEITR